MAWTSIDMRLALINGFRSEPKPGLVGVCPGCGAGMVPKCGEHRMWHWAHRGVRHCDHWWEPETEWHVNWKSRFQTEWQETIRWADDGEKHIADVMAPDGRVIEFQHSPLPQEERRARENFYGSMVWVVDGLARKRDRGAFEKTLSPLNTTPVIYSGHPLDSALLRDWGGAVVDVFFDFGERDEDVAKFGAPILWHLHPNELGRIFLTPVPTDFFVRAFREGMLLPRVVVRSNPAPPISAILPARSARFLWQQARRRRRF